MVLLLVWCVAYVAAGNELLVPALSDCLKEVGRLLMQGDFWRALFFSLLRAAAAFGISFLFALVFAVIAYLLPSFAPFFAPVVAALRSLPVLAILLILLTVFSAGTAPVAVAFLALFPLLYTAILSALSGVDRQLVDMARVCGASKARLVTRVYLPLAAPHILREASGALSYSIKLVVSAEVLSRAARSLGGMLQEAQIYEEIPMLFALVAVTFLAALAVELVGGVLTEFVENRGLK